MWESPLIEQYCLSFYTSLLALMGNDHLSRGDYHIAFTALLTLLGAIMLATLFGELAVLVKDLRSRDIA